MEGLQRAQRRRLGFQSSARVHRWSLCHLSSRRGVETAAAQEADMCRQRVGGPTAEADDVTAARSRPTGRKTWIHAFATKEIHICNISSESLTQQRSLTRLTRNIHNAFLASLVTGPLDVDVAVEKEGKRLSETRRIYSHRGEPSYTSHIFGSTSDASVSSTKQGQPVQR